ncbi:MAG: efflux RND transporter permease subunit, partial [Pseudomonadota bacterium]
MKFIHFCIDRPIFATVLSVLIVLVGAISYFGLPVAQYPEVAPPTIQVSASYPGASAEIVADTVATPLEQEINGVEGMLYMLSQSTGDGRLTLTITFKLGTDLDKAQVLVQNRVAIAEPRLPEAVRRLGVTTRKNSPDLMMVIHVVSPDDSRDQLYLSNYAKTQIVDELARIEGVGEARIFAERAFSMRVWLDPERMAARLLTAGEVVDALRQNNLQVASGVLNQMPVSRPGAFELNVQTLGRLVDPAQFENIVNKTEDGGRTVRVRDIGRVELGAQDYTTNGYLDGKPALPILIFQRPGTNALETAETIIGTLDEMAQSFPEGLEHTIVYNPTEFIQQSVNAVYLTIFEAVALVVLVVIAFLQSLRASIIPIIAIPVSLIGTFAIMLALGYTLNLLTLFGLILAIGIVVDDAIVVVENVERNIANGMSPKEASTRTMDEVQSAIIGTTLVLIAVFVPAALVPGITGQFYRQFAVTISVATVISTFNSLSLSPALAASVLKPASSPPGFNPLRLLTTPLANAFNRGFAKMADLYASMVRRLVGSAMSLALSLAVFV